MRKLTAAIAVISLTACNQGSESGGEEAPPSGESKNVASPDAQPQGDNFTEVETRYTEGDAFLVHGGSVDRVIEAETLQGKGPNKSLRFFVEYRAKMGWNASEFKKLGRRYCRWNYTHNNIDRVVYVIRTENNKEEVANGKRTQAGPIPGNDETADNCNNVQNNVIAGVVNDHTSRARWDPFIRDDRPRIEGLLDDPI